MVLRRTRITHVIIKFFKLESASGILLIMAAIAALILANSPLAPFYQQLIETPFQVRIGSLDIDKPLLLWINDGLMAVFFFLIGLELKKEFMEGMLSSVSQVVLPAIGAIGGMAIPAAMYLFFNYQNSEALSGWAIPTATDIAFTLGIISLLGSRVPLSLKVFVTSLAIFDDLGAIIIIALFYTDNISANSLLIVLGCMVLLFSLNYRNVRSTGMYVVLGLIMWVAMLKSGVHATLTGVILAMFIPMYCNNDKTFSPLKTMEHDLAHTVAFLVIPIFAFANSGVRILGASADELLHPVPVGVAIGLFFGKQIGIFALCWAAIKLKIASLPANSNWLGLYAVAVLCGVGFTMSLFIGSLAFSDDLQTKVFDERLGIIAGSLASGLVGYFLLRKSVANNSVDTHQSHEPTQAG